MAKGKVVLVNPTVIVPDARPGELAPRLASLEDKQVGILWNEKPNGDILLARLEKRLGEAFGFSGRVWRDKRPAAPVSKEILDEFAGNCDLVISAICD